MEPPELFQHDHTPVLVMLKDGRLLEGELIRMTDYWCIGDDRFYDHDVEEITPTE